MQIVFIVSQMDILMSNFINFENYKNIYFILEIIKDVSILMMLYLNYLRKNMEILSKHKILTKF